MALEIAKYGIVQRHDEGGVTIHRLGKNGGMGTEIEVPETLAEEYRLATGDVVTGETAPLTLDEPETAHSDEVMEDEAGWDEQVDEPRAAQRLSVPNWLMTRRFQTERLLNVQGVNGLPRDEAAERPFPRAKRSHSERMPPDYRLRLAAGPHDVTGRLLDVVAPLGRGYAGIVYGPHASGLTRILRAVASGVAQNAPETVLLILLLRARSEEITDWRRRFPQADVIVCPSAQGETTAEQTLRTADLTLECAQRQTELGRHVLLLLDSLTGLWGAMLEAEAADAQAEADISQARQTMRAWMQKAGDFRGETPLGGSLGGSLTLLGAVWNQAVDEEAEEERDLHPHLRLLEHILHETAWRVPLSGALAAERLYPAINALKCFSQREDALQSEAEQEAAQTFRRVIANAASPLERYHVAMAWLDAQMSP